MSGKPMSEKESLAIYEAAVAPHAAALEAAGNTEQAQREYNLATVPLFEEHKARIGQVGDAQPQEPEPEPESEPSEAPDQAEAPSAVEPSEPEAQPKARKATASK